MCIRDRCHRSRGRGIGIAAAHSFAEQPFATSAWRTAMSSSVCLRPSQSLRPAGRARPEKQSHLDTTARHRRSCAAPPARIRADDLECHGHHDQPGRAGERDDEFAASRLGCEARENVADGRKRGHVGEGGRDVKGSIRVAAVIIDTCCCSAMLKRVYHAPRSGAQKDEEE
eukprot:3994506-Prymnesium_polylepis.2